MKYIIGSGWWCADKSIDTRAELLGSDEIRGQQFHHLWYKAIDRYTSPEKIIIIDSCSPTKPITNQSDNRIELVKLNVNGGHSTNHLGKFCGYTRAILLSLEYAQQCETEYFVYVEQDALIFGEGIIEYCIEQMDKPYMYGNGANTAGILQQSFFIIKQNAIQYFIDKLKAIDFTDNQLSPEYKFHIASSFWPSNLTSKISKHSDSNAFFKWLNWQHFKYFRNWCELPIGYGRVRPIDFSQPYFYFQHGSLEELDQYLALTKIDWTYK